MQAKSYITLAKIGVLSGKETAKEANIAPQDIYHVLLELQEKGLIEKIIAKPNKYRAIPFQQGISLLLQRRDKQTAELKQKTLEILEIFQPIELERKLTSNEFILIPEGSIANKAMKAIETAQSSIDFMNDCSEIMLAHQDLTASDLKALKKGVKIRFILTRDSERQRATKSFLSSRKSNPDFQLRYLDSPIQTKVIIKDNNEVYISTVNKVNTVKQPHLWSNNTILVQIIKQWYDVIWEKSA
jgi:sugar-specific transcriptional regulator TrmB